MTARHPAPHTKAPRDWNDLFVWKQRRRHQLATRPLCERCEKRGLVVAATVAHHNPPHNNDWNRFRTGPLESLCAQCHEAEHDRSRGYSTAIDPAIDPATGYPCDLRHPCASP
jgi:hypothetical protein